MVRNSLALRGGVVSTLGTPEKAIEKIVRRW
jgi:hypothetical protein